MGADYAWIATDGRSICDEVVMCAGVCVSFLWDAYSLYVFICGSGVYGQRRVANNYVRFINKPLHTEEFRFHRTRDTLVVISFPYLFLLSTLYVF